MVVRLPAVKFPVVIRPSGGLTLLISLSVFLFSFCLSASISLRLSVFLQLYVFFFPVSLSPFSLKMHLSNTLYVCHTDFFLNCCSFTLISLQHFTAFCPWPLHSNLCNGNPLMYAAILVLQYVNWRDIEPHLWMGSTSL